MRVALVTGGGSGIGRSAALELNKIDFTVYVVGRREEELIKTSSLATNNNHKIIPIKTDITIGSQVIALFDKRIRNIIMINNITPTIISSTYSLSKMPSK